MINTKIESPSWRDFATARAVSSTETHAGPVSVKSADFRNGALEPAAWDPYEVWLTRVKQPRDAQKK
jgi:hypothetical protein